ncbi:MAG: aldehyde dehydrogenase family protein [Pseudomonadota bacterium]
MSSNATTPAPENMSLADWQNLAESIQIESRLFINGEYVDAQAGKTFESVNPANGQLLANVAEASEADVDLAVVAAKAAWDSGVWRNMSPRDRMAVMQRFADLVEENTAELALLDCLDIGKPISDMLSIDIPEVVVTLRYFAECIDKIEGAVTNTDPSVLHMIQREPLGVVGAISAWNYPLLMAVWKIAPALAAGNTVVLKPAEQGPLGCIRLAQLFIDAGGPAGVLNVVNGPGQVVGKALALHNGVAKISFTGSTGTGKQIMIYAGQSNMKRVALETGGKSPQIFMPDLEDMDEAIEYAIGGIYDNSGQVCNAGSRFLVHESIHDEFVSKFTAISQQMYQPGDPLDPDTSLGPMVTHAHQQRVLGKVAEGVAAGASLMYGGHPPEAEALKDGAYIQPGLFTGVENSMSIAQEEIFGPIASVLKFSTEEQALAIANDSIYGLAAGVWTNDLKTAHRMVKGIESGLVWVNCFGDGDMTQPFGGYKQSGNTRDKSMECFLGYTQSKSAWIKLD